MSPPSANDDLPDVDVADWFAMVDKAVDWLLAHPDKGSMHALYAIAESPAEQAFVAGLIAPLEQDDLRTFLRAVQRAWEIRLGGPRTRRR